MECGIELRWDDCCRRSQSIGIEGSDSVCKFTQGSSSFHLHDATSAIVRVNLANLFGNILPEAAPLISIKIKISKVA